MATAIAERMGLSPSEVGSPTLASLMHDVGKIGIPDRVLKGTGRSSRRSCPHEHARAGAYDILSDIDDFRDVARVALHHHER